MKLKTNKIMQNTMLKSVEGSQSQALESIFTMKAISFMLEGNDDIDDSVEEETEEDEEEMEDEIEEGDDDEEDEETESEEDDEEDEDEE
jgi:hypothetical protein